MWTCTRCQAENHDSLSVCETCGSPRAAGRFGQNTGMGNTARMPRVTAPVRQGAAARPAVPAAPAAPAAPAVPATPAAPAAPAAPIERRACAPDPEPPKRSAVRVLAKAVGGLLLVLLPLLCGALCAVNQSALKEALLPLLLPDGTDAAVGALCYWALAAIAVLVSMLPGLWTILLAGSNGRRRPARRE